MISGSGSELSATMGAVTNGYQPGWALLCQCVIARSLARDEHSVAALGTRARLWFGLRRQVAAAMGAEPA